MQPILHYLKRFLGLSERGNSALGRFFRETIKHNHARHGGGLAIIVLVTFVLIVENFSNVGGAIAISTSIPASPVIDAETIASVQTPITFSYESRGISFFHPGVDLVAETGTPVKPIMPGVVEHVGYDPLGYGNHIIIKHEGGYESLYGHLSQVKVKEGQNVELATVIGLSGSTGFSTGPHLHLEVHYNGQVINPADLVPKVN